ncbi:MAG: PAS domain S-box protein [Geobacteraceae bacterium]|nr:PAS domain S-box protein [Geobacteraceae bacterium]
MPDFDKSTDLPRTINELQERVALLEAALREQERADSERLHESEALYKSILKASPDIITVTDLAGLVRMASPSSLTMFGYTREEEMLGRLITDFLVPEDRERAHANITLMHQGVFTGPGEYRGLHSTGSVFDIEANAEFIRDSTNQPTGMVFIVRDITERKRAIDALKESEEHFKLTFYTSPDSINITRLEDGLYIDINEGFTRMSGYTREDVIGKTAIEINIWYYPEDRQEMIRRLKETGYCENFETMFRKKDGSTIIGFFSARIISLNGIPHLISVTQDITERKRAEKALFESESLYHSILKASPDNITIADLDGRVRVASPSGLTMFGYTREDEVVGCFVTDFLVPEDRERAHANIALIRLGVVTGPNEYRGLHAEGSVFDIEVNAEFIRDEINQPTGMVFIVRDITERKRAEKALRESESLYRSILKASPDIIIITDLDSRIRMASPSTHTILGYSPEIEGRLITDFLAPKEYERARSSISVIQQGVFTGPEEFRALRTDGSMFDIEANGRFIFDTTGQPTGMVFIVRDITERKRAEAERERLMAAIEQTGEVIMITDPLAVIQYVNPAFERVTGYSREEVIGKNPRILKSGEQDKAFYDTLWKTLAEGRTWEGCFINKRKIGTLYTEEAVISPVRDTSGTIVNYVAVKRDITRELETEQQLQQSQKMEFVGRLAGGIAHDFNNLLLVIINYADMSRKKVPSDHPIANWLDEIANAGQRSADITRQLLAFARKQTIAPKVLNLNETMMSMLKLLRRLIGEDIDLALIPGANLWLVKLDPSQIDQILANLCVNARDAISGVGTVTIETGNITLDDIYCESHAGAVPGEYVLLTISDNGCGMEKDVLEHIFDPFFTTKDVGKGTGLGLATVYGIIRQNHGLIDVQSEPGKGTTFRIYLPRFVGQVEETKGSFTAEAPRGKGETILLVEDDNALRVTCELLLDTLGYNVVVAESPAFAYDVVARHPADIDALLTDVVMPGMDGRQLAEKICPIKPDLKVLYMSGYTSDVIDHHGILEPGVHFIAKPFSLAELARKLREVLEAD